MYEALGANAPAYRPAGKSSGLLFGVVGFVAGAMVVGAAWALFTSSAATSEPEDTFTLRGTMALTASGSTRLSGTTCAGTGGYSDIREGASVTVYDPQGSVIAIGHLGTSSTSTTTSSYSEPCTFKFEVAGVPGHHRFYQVEVSRRGKVTSEQNAAKSGSVALSLGMK
ncbi:hypothetical protein NLX83_25255 [Allokutzneria sp. A3M-2-11 16]|uniref:hypothetical protein n=1 Tax=Allokutzneria sp. A3M-2-11 16 TaxID=2962043 RepID=UPI0020B80B10|nr:hypothetical protein [Allokutzneria sp. A3M-2-11 16]MCP3802584.1 hypothetical protein [Allokutzneria sp. A3M-2-11 16]